MNCLLFQRLNHSSSILNCACQYTTRVNGLSQGADDILLPAITHTLRARKVVKEKWGMH